MYIVKNILGTDELTGLQKELRIVNFAVDAERKIITVTYTVVLVSPTGLVMKELERGLYDRYNSTNNPKYDQLEQSSIGQGIKMMLEQDFPLYPNFTQNI